MRLHDKPKSSVKDDIGIVKSEQKWRANEIWRQNKSKPHLKDSLF